MLPQYLILSSASELIKTLCSFYLFIFILHMDDSFKIIFIYFEEQDWFRKDCLSLVACPATYYNARFKNTSLYLYHNEFMFMVTSGKALKWRLCVTTAKDSWCCWIQVQPHRHGQQRLLAIKVLLFYLHFIMTHFRDNFFLSLQVFHQLRWRETRPALIFQRSRTS